MVESKGSEPSGTPMTMSQWPPRSRRLIMSSICGYQSKERSAPNSSARIAAMRFSYPRSLRSLSGIACGSAHTTMSHAPAASVAWALAIIGATTNTTEAAAARRAAAHLPFNLRTRAVSSHPRSVGPVGRSVVRLLVGWCLRFVHVHVVRISWIRWISLFRRIGLVLAGPALLTSGLGRALHRLVGQREDVERRAGAAITTPSIGRGIGRHLELARATRRDDRDVLLAVWPDVGHGGVAEVGAGHEL